MQNTTEIKVLGTGTSKHQMVTSVIKEYLAKAGISIPVNDYTDVDTFLKGGIDSIPAVLYNEQIYNIGSNGSFNSGLRKAVNAVLKRSNYGCIEKVVIPVDFSDISTNAFAYGHRLATDIGAVTKAVHVYFPSAQEVKKTTVYVDFAQLRESYLEDFVSSFDTDWGSDLMRASLVDGEFRNGFPGDEILNSIEDNGAFLAIMGTTGQSGFLKKWFGSVSYKVMNEAPAPVMIIPEEANYKGINKIAYAYEDIGQDKSVVTQLATIAGKFGADIHLIHVNDERNPDPGYYLTELLSKHYPSGKITTSSIDGDDIVESVTGYCLAHAIDLISLSTHKKGVIERLYDDNISQQMSVMSTLPLLVLKPLDS